jgi:hypothetical protein
MEPFLTWLLGATAGLLPPEQRQWVEAVLADAPAVPAGPARRRWLLGGLVLVVRGRPVPRSRLALLSGVYAAMLGCAALVGYALVRYPSVATDSPVVTAVYLGIFVLMFAGYALVAFVLANLPSPATGCGAAFGAAGGILGFAALAVLNAVPGSPILAALVAGPPLCALAAAGAAAARRALPYSDHPNSALATGAIAGAWGGMVGALVVFVLMAGGTLAFPNPVRDAPANLPESIRHNPHTLAAAAVSDAFGGAINFLWLMPPGALLLGFLGAAVAQATRHADWPSPA